MSGFGGRFPTGGDPTIHYKLDKALANPWNGLIGMEADLENDNYPQPFASSGLVFLGRDDATSPHPSLFVTDGTSAGTDNLRHLDDQTSVITVDPFAPDPSLFTSLAGAPFGALIHAVPNRELWMSDGFPASTQHVATTSGVGYWLPLRATSVNGRAFAHDGGQGLWSIEGTVSSFEQVAATSNTGHYPDPLPIRAGLAYFAQDQDLWSTGGTAATTTLVEANAGEPLNFIDGSLYLRHWLPSPAVPELRRWRPGEPSVALGQGEVLRVFRVAGHHLFFVNDELREVVGNTTALVASFPSQRFEGSVATPFGLFFIASDAAGAELWVSDGTTAGTQRFGDLAPGARSSDPRRLTASSHALYFVADDGVHGRELWRTDGTVAGTRIVRDIVPGPGSSVPEHLAMIDGLLMFSASNGSDGRELWVSNGTEAGTVQIQDVAPGPESSTPHQFVVGKDRVFFIATDAVHGFELWSMSRAALAAAAPHPAIAFFTLPPCRLLDSRDELGVLFSGTSVSVKAHGLCGVPTGARSLVVNVTVVQPTNSGTFEIGADHPADSPLRLPVAGGTTRASHAILALSKSGEGTFRVAVDLTSGGSTHWLVDVVGYFE